MRLEAGGPLEWISKMAGAGCPLRSPTGLRAGRRASYESNAWWSSENVLYKVCQADDERTWKPRFLHATPFGNHGQRQSEVSHRWPWFQVFIHIDRIRRRPGTCRALSRSQKCTQVRDQINVLPRIERSHWNTGYSGAYTHSASSRLL